jgi:hypothetical protein
MLTKFSLSGLIAASSLVCIVMTASCRTDEVPTSPLTPTPTEIAWSSCSNGFSTVAWLAIQDGTGPWRQITGVNGTFAFQLDSNLAGVAYVRLSGSAEHAETHIRFYTAEELKSIRPLCIGLIRVGGKEVRGTIATLGPLEYSEIALGGSSAYVSGSGIADPAQFTLRDIQSGRADLIAVRGSTCQTRSACGGATGVIIRRNLDPPDGSALPVLDFSDAREAFQLLPKSLTITNLTVGETIRFNEWFATARTSSSVPLMDEMQFTTVSAAARAAYYAVPDDRLSASDVHRLGLSAASANSVRQTLVEIHGSDDASIAMPPLFPPVTIVTARQPGFATVRTDVAQTAGSKTWLAEFDQSNVDIIVRVSAGYARANNVTLNVPSFAGVSGWSSSWGLRPGSVTPWSIFAINLGATLIDNLTGAPPPYEASSRFGLVTP